MDEKLYRHLQSEKARLETEVFVSPPKSFEEFQKRYGKWLQITEILKHMVDTAKKDPDE